MVNNISIIININNIINRVQLMLIDCCRIFSVIWIS